MYYASKIKLNFSIKPSGYSKPIAAVPDGSYDLYVFVTTEFGQDSKAIHFTVISDSIPYTLVLLGVSVLLIAIGVLVYFKKRKNWSETRLSSILTKNI